MKILVQGVNFPYEFSSFGPHIMLHTVVILKNIAKMFEFLNPWKLRFVKKLLGVDKTRNPYTIVNIHGQLFNHFHTYLKIFVLLFIIHAIIYGFKAMIEL